MACDGLLYPAHKFLLATCSEYFNDIFKANLGNNVVVILKDVKSQDLQYLMDYMYLGEVNVAQSQLASLIKTAECLKVKGLAIPDDEPHHFTTIHKDHSSSDDRDREISPPSKRKCRSNSEDRQSSNLIALNRSTSSLTVSRSSHSTSFASSHSESDGRQSRSSAVPISRNSTVAASLAFRGANSHTPSSHVVSPNVLQSQLSQSNVIRMSPHPIGFSLCTNKSSDDNTTLIKEEPPEPADNLHDTYMNDAIEDTKPTLGDEDISTAGSSGLLSVSLSFSVFYRLYLDSFKLFILKSSM